MWLSFGSRSRLAPDTEGVHTRKPSGVFLIPRDLTVRYAKLPDVLSVRPQLPPVAR